MLSRLRIPDLATLTSVVLAVVSITLTLQQRYGLAIAVLPAMAILDGVDGYLASLTKRQDRFGAELDSLTDFLTFGVTLAVLWLGLSSRTAMDVIPVTVFLGALAIRLANVNLRPPNERTLGAACTWNGVVFPALYLAGFVRYFPIGFLVMAALMVSPIRIPRLLVRAGERGIPTIRVVM